MTNQNLWTLVIVYKDRIDDAEMIRPNSALYECQLIRRLAWRSTE